MKPGDMIRLPIRATYTVDRASGDIIDRQFDYANMPTAAVAEFFLDRFGIDAEPAASSGRIQDEGRKKAPASAVQAEAGKGALERIADHS